MAEWFNLIGPDLFELGLLGKNHSSLLYSSNYIISVIYSLYNLVPPISYIRHTVLNGFTPVYPKVL